MQEAVTYTGEPCFNIFLGKWESTINHISHTPIKMSYYESLDHAGEILNS
jgi:hypothetical protein